MAEKIDKEVCRICLHDFKRPRKLDCSHTFCYICLEDYINRTSENNLFHCPLCRQEFSLPEGGVGEFMSDVNVVETSEGATETSVVPPCEVCKRDFKSEFRCGDCEQFLCSSCRTIHDSLNLSKDHTVVDAEDFVATIGEDKSGYTDVCIHHPKKRARCYCKNCEKAVCADCFVSEHSGHVFIDLQSDDTREKEREKLQNLNKVVETELTRHQHHLDVLQTLITNINMSSDAVNDSIDKKVDEICSNLKKLGEEIKVENEKLRRKEEKKIRKLVENCETLVEDLKASIKHTGNILEDKLMEQVIKRKTEVEKEKMAATMRKLDIPVVNYPCFEKRNTHKTQLSEQLGKLKVKKMFTTSFNFDDEDLQSGKLYKGDVYNIDGLSWYVSARKERNNLGIFLNQTKTECHQNTSGIYLRLTPSVKSCDAEYSLKLINHKNIRESVEGHKDRRTFTSNVERHSDPPNFGGYGSSSGFGSLYSQQNADWCRGWPEFINWNKFSNKQNGFLTEDNTFVVQATVKVLKIEH